jgi:mono/diheme cytochrome c family protein
MKILLTIALTLLTAAAIAAGVIHGGGLTNFAADEPHPKAIEEAIAYTRERFIAARSEDIEVPDLDDPQKIADGAAHYVPMCAGCHLGPGTQDTEIRAGLYPQPPNLAQPAGHAGGHDHSDTQKAAARQFWIIKHGIKMTGMPAWGTTHDDEAIWGLVAFLQRLPGMTPEEYVALTGGEVGSHDHGAHPHGATESGDGHAGHDHGKQPTAQRTLTGHIDPPGAPAHSHDDSKKAKGAGEGHDHAH